MSTLTKNLGLVKPELSDAADITATNGNWDKIDGKFNEIDGKLNYDEKLAEINRKLDELDDQLDDIPTDEALTAINGRLDEIDEKLPEIEEKLDNAYSDENKPSASDIGAVPLDGGQSMTGSLKIKGYGEIDAFNTLTYVKASKDISNFRYLRVINPSTTDYSVAKAIQWGNVVAGIEKVYDIHGAHNKPGGSYSGNGSASQRIIVTEGIGYGLLLWSPHGCAIVTPSGAICMSADGVKSLVSSTVTFTAGTLSFKTTDGIFNASGVTYNYQVL